MSYTITREEIDAILELCVGYNTRVSEHYKKHSKMALKELTRLISPLILEKLAFESGPLVESGCRQAALRLGDRVKKIVVKERTEEKAERDIKAAKDTFDEIREMLKQAEEAMGQNKDAASAWESLEQVKQIIGVKRKADEDDTKDEPDIEIVQLPTPKRQA